MVVPALPSNGSYEETIIVAELWGLNTSAGVGSAFPTGAILPQFGQARKHIFRSVKQTLKQRQLAHIDVLYYYISDANESLAETMRALNDVVEGGYVQYVVVSSQYVWQLRAMRVYGVANRLTSFVSFQEHSSSDFAWVGGDQKAASFEELGNDFTRPLGPLERTIVFESLA